MTAEYPVWTGEGWIQVEIPAMEGEALVVPNVAAVVYSEDRTRILLQRRDKAGEAVRGRLEVPGGRWRAGESPQDVVHREVLEETGLTVVEMLTGSTDYNFTAGISIQASRPSAVVAGLGGAYPAVLLAFECTATGVPRALAGETAAPAWWDLDDVSAHLDNDPDDFVWQTAAILREVLA
jgi:8-oxo-dGTP pyrophosphatase MutT (NUDIX family)